MTKKRTFQRDHVRPDMIARVVPPAMIARKWGPAVAAEASLRAQSVLSGGRSKRPTEVPAYADFDAWLRADGHRRNPGATADLMAAALFLALCRVETAALPRREQLLTWARVTR